MSEENSKGVKEISEQKNQNTNQPEKKTSTGKTCCIIAVIIIVAIMLFIASFFFRYWIAQRFYNSPTTSSENTGGNWRLDMTQTTTATGIETALDTSGSGSLSFQMPASGTFEATGDWNSEGGGTVGSSRSESTISGKVMVRGEINGNKLRLNISFTEEVCHTTLVTPLGTSVNDVCDPSTLPDPHNIELDIRDGAAASDDVTTDKNGYRVVWRENWTLHKQ